MMKRPTVILIGGFLGAGKTTLLLHVAKHLAGRGKKVGLITNDQASDMVDTRLIRQHEIPVREVAGSCFCCNFNALVGATDSLRDEAAAEIILAESVGSCTDLSATIMQPMKEKLHQQYALSPVSVVVDPLRLTEIYPELSFAGLSPEARVSTLHESAGYIVRKQMEEADFLLLNKMDLLSRKELEEVTALLAKEYPQAIVLGISAVTGDGVESWLEQLFAMPKAGTHIAAVDYDIYAEGEAILGWLNAAVSLRQKSGQGKWREFCQKLMAELDGAFTGAHADTGHVKIIIANGKNSIISNLTRTAAAPGLHGDIPAAVPDVEMLINARVEMTPERLEGIVRTALSDACALLDIEATVTALKSLSPGRPEPTWRYATVWDAS